MVLKSIRALFLYSVISLILPVSIYSQANIAQKAERLKFALSDSEKIDVYNNIVNAYMYTKPDSAAYYAQQGMEYAISRKYWLGQGIMMGQLAILDQSQGRMILSRKRLTDALEIFKELDYQVGIADANNGLGILEAKKGNYQGATKYFFTALKINEGIKNIQGISETYLKLGALNEQNGNLDRAIDYYKKVEELSGSLPFSESNIMFCNNLGIVYDKLGKYGLAINYFQRGLSLSNEAKYAGIRVLLYINMGIAFDHMDSTDAAIVYQSKALSTARDSKMREEEARSLISLASITAKVNADKSLEYLNEALSITKAIGQKKLEIDIYQQMGTIYKLRTMYKEALDDFEKGTVLKDSLFNVEKAKEVANLEATYDLDKTKGTINRLELKSKKNALQRDIILDIAGSIIFIFFIFAIFYRNTKRLNGKLMVQQLQLQEMNTVKDKIFSIIGHDLRSPINGIIGMLDLMENDTTGLDPEELREIFSRLNMHSKASLDTLDKLLYWGQSRIKGIALQQKEFNVTSVIENNLGLLKEFAGQKEIQMINNVAKDVRIYADTSHFDFVIRNLLSNAIKFCNTNGTIKIHTENSLLPLYIIFAVTDDGIGMIEKVKESIFEAFNTSREGTAREKGTSLGLMLCKEFITENGGKIWAESEAGKGATFYFSLKAYK
jgi:signal transduction histidine kinase/Flp pilus assembly protein TadD